MIKEIAMSALPEFSRTAQRSICMLLSAVIVTVSLSLWVSGSQLPLHDGYSVTVTQLQ